MRISAGLLIIWNNKILLGHPVGAKWFGTFTIPKGGVEESETYLQAAIRETSEEVGLVLTENDVIKDDVYVIDYKDKKNGRVYKKVCYYPVLLSELTPIFKEDGSIDKKYLQKDEIDWAGFLSIDQAEKRLFDRQSQILETFKKYKDKI